MSKLVALVTGANKGIGFFICEKLCKIRSDLTVLLGSRDEKNGEEAVEKLKAKGCQNVVNLKIDVDDEKSVQAAAELVKNKYGGLNILINNAGRAWKGDTLNEEVARTTIQTNYYGIKSVSKSFMPLIRENGRIVNVSSTMGQSTLSRLAKPLADKFMDPNLTEQQLDGLMEQFISDVKSGTYQDKGWIKSAYGVSKAGVSMYTRVLARENKIPGLLINSCCPGWCRTDMAGPKASKSAEEGAETPVFLALMEGDGKGGPTGLFFIEKKIAPFDKTL